MIKWVFALLQINYFEDWEFLAVSWILLRVFKEAMKIPVDDLCNYCLDPHLHFYLKVWELKSIFNSISYECQFALLGEISELCFMYGMVSARQSQVPVLLLKGYKHSCLLLTLSRCRTIFHGCSIALTFVHYLGTHKGSVCSDSAFQNQSSENWDILLVSTARLAFTDICPWLGCLKN